MVPTIKKIWNVHNVLSFLYISRERPYWETRFLTFCIQYYQEVLLISFSWIGYSTENEIIILNPLQGNVFIILQRYIILCYFPYYVLDFRLLCIIPKLALLHSTRIISITIFFLFSQDNALYLKIT